MNRSIWSVLVITMTILLIVTATASAAIGSAMSTAGDGARAIVREATRTPGPSLCWYMD